MTCATIKLVSSAGRAEESWLWRGLPTSTGIWIHALHTHVVIGMLIPCTGTRWHSFGLVRDLPRLTPENECHTGAWDIQSTTSIFATSGNINGLFAISVSVEGSNLHFGSASTPPSPYTALLSNRSIPSHSRTTSASTPSFFASGI